VSIDYSKSGNDKMNTIKIVDNNLTSNETNYANFNGDLNRIYYSNFELGTSDFTMITNVNSTEFHGKIPDTRTTGGWIYNKGLTIYGTPRRAGFGLRAALREGKNYFEFYIGGQHDQLYHIRSQAVESNKWYTIAVVRQKGILKLLIDGKTHDQLDIPIDLNVNSNIPFTVGSINKLGNDAKGTGYFEGKIGAIQIFNKVLSINKLKKGT